MENVVLTVHLILAVLLTGVVLLQRSEGGGLGMGGGAGGVMTGRQAANALTRLTWIFGIALFVTSVTLTIIAARQASNSSIMDQMGVPESQQPTTGLPALPSYAPPPSSGSGDPLTPPAPDAAPAAATPRTATPDVAAPDAVAPAPTAPAATPEAAAPAAPAPDAIAPPPSASAPAAPATPEPAAEPVVESAAPDAPATAPVPAPAN